MGSVFKKQYTKPVPERAELVERKGHRIARWRDKRGKLRTAPVTTGEDGTPRLLFESGAWYARYRDHAGLVVEASTECRDEQAARQVLARWERDAERIKAGYATPAEKEMSGHQFSAIEDHFGAYDRSLQASGASDIHDALGVALPPSEDLTSGLPQLHGSLLAPTCRRVRVHSSCRPTARTARTLARRTGRPGGGRKDTEHLSWSHRRLLQLGCRTQPANE